MFNLKDKIEAVVDLQCSLKNGLVSRDSVERVLTSLEIDGFNSKLFTKEYSEINLPLADVITSKALEVLDRTLVTQTSKDILEKAFNDLNEKLIKPLSEINTENVNTDLVNKLKEDMTKDVTYIDDDGVVKIIDSNYNEYLIYDFFYYNGYKRLIKYISEYGNKELKEELIYLVSEIREDTVKSIFPLSLLSFISTYENNIDNLESFNDFKTLRIETTVDLIVSNKILINLKSLSNEVLTSLMSYDTFNQYDSISANIEDLKEIVENKSISVTKNIYSKRIKMIDMVNGLLNDKTSINLIKLFYKLLFSKKEI